ASEPFFFQSGTNLGANYTRISDSQAIYSKDFTLASCIPKVEAKKTADKTEVTAAGTVVTYTITVKNTGNTTLTAVAVNDALTGTSTPSSVTWNTLPGG